MPFDPMLIVFVATTVVTGVLGLIGILDERRYEREREQQLPPAE